MIGANRPIWDGRNPLFIEALGETITSTPNSPGSRCGRNPLFIEALGETLQQASSS